MNHRMAEALADMNASMLKEKINELITERGQISAKIETKEKELQEICPHLNTKTIHGEIPGDYYNKGTYYSIENCVLCGKELNREESPSSYG